MGACNLARLASCLLSLDDQFAFQTACIRTIRGGCYVLDAGIVMFNVNDFQPQNERCTPSCRKALPIL